MIDDGTIRATQFMTDQLAAAAAVAAVAACASAAGRRAARSAWRGVGRLVAGRPWLVIVATALVSLLVALPLVALHDPEPRVHDEFSYLLAADTFARGRLTNPTPAAPEAFETMHVIVHPTYASKYPPGQGLMLAIGKVLAHRAVIGAYLGAAAACAAVAWALLARLPARWALVGGLIAATHPRVLYWANCYWGGQIALAGGALMLGAAWRMIRSRDARPAWSAALAAGVGLLVLSRPGEGLFFTIGLAGWTLWRLRGAPLLGDRPAIAWRVVLPSLVVLAPLAAWLCCYNYRVTGAWYRPAYVEYLDQYGVAPPFAFMPARPEPTFNNQPLRDLQAGWEMDFWRAHRTVLGYGRAVASKWLSVSRDALLVGAVPIWIGAAIVAARRRGPARRTALAVAAFVGFISLVETWMMSHYVAPVGAAVALLAVEGVRALRRWRPAGVPRAGRVVALATLAVAAIGAVRYELDALRSYGWQYDRQALVDRLVASGGRHLVFVRYSPGHDMMREWVANSAEIASQAVIFCRDLDDKVNAEVRARYAADGRSVWLLKPDEDFFAVTPY